MIKSIIGPKGTGKTKRLIEMVHDAAEKDSGNVVCIEYGDKLKFDISHKVRLIDIKNYNIKSAQALEGFIAGLVAGNYDISTIFIDSVLKIIGEDLEALGRILDDLNNMLNKIGVNLIVIVSAEPDLAPPSLAKYQ